MMCALMNAGFDCRERIGRAGGPHGSGPPDARLPPFVYDERLAPRYGPWRAAIERTLLAFHAWDSLSLASVIS